jgi:UV DNA damage endonuclease
MIRAGLCCIFRQQPITFRRTTYRYLKKFSRKEQLRHIARLILHNARSLLQTLHYCHVHGIGDFRINSRFLPLATHPDVGYRPQDLPDWKEIERILLQSAAFAGDNNIRMTFHPDQFILLNSPSPSVTGASIKELISQAELAAIVGADVITIHAGGGYGNKKEALKRLAGRIKDLPLIIKKRLALENDDRLYTPKELLAFCNDLHSSGYADIPFVYDVHHHRCLQDGMEIEEVTRQAITTWNREPLFHISSPLNGWSGPETKKHHDYIEKADIPRCWLSLDMTVEVETKAKERAVLDFIEKLKGMV